VLRTLCTICLIAVCIFLLVLFVCIMEDYAALWTWPVFNIASPLKMTDKTPSTVTNSNVSVRMITPPPVMRFILEPSEIIQPVLLISSDYNPQPNSIRSLIPSLVCHNCHKHENDEIHHSEFYRQLSYLIYHTRSRFVLFVRPDVSVRWMKRYIIPLLDQTYDTHDVNPCPTGVRMLGGTVQEMEGKLCISSSCAILVDRLCIRRVVEHIWSVRHENDGNCTAADLWPLSWWKHFERADATQMITVL